MYFKSSWFIKNLVLSVNIIFNLSEHRNNGLNLKAKLNDKELRQATSGSVISKSFVVWGKTSSKLKLVQKVEFDRAVGFYW